MNNTFIENLAAPVIRKSGAALNRSGSKQDYATPMDFRSAVIRRYGMPTFDLAADKDSFFAEGPGRCFFGKEDNSLNQCWADLRGMLWLNPPFGNIAPWARKCALESVAGARILLLVPASVGSNWYRDCVYRHASTVFLNGRICFDGIAGYPKDCMLCSYGEPTEEQFGIWSWNT